MDLLAYFARSPFACAADNSFADALGKDVSEIGAESDFFRDLEGTSLDYFTLLSLVKNRLGIDAIGTGETKLSTVRAFADFVKGGAKEK